MGAALDAGLAGAFSAAGFLPGFSAASAIAFGLAEALAEAFGFLGAVSVSVSAALGLAAVLAAALRATFRNNDIGYQLVSAGAYFAYLRHPFAGETARDVAKRLAEDENMLCLPGSMFGPGQEDYLRFAFANVDADQMPEIARRLARSASGRS